jgi:hypothetical protein
MLMQNDKFPFDPRCPICATARKVAGYNKTLLVRLLAIDFPIRVQSPECGHSWVVSPMEKARLRQYLDGTRGAGTLPETETGGEPA